MNKVRETVQRFFDAFPDLVAASEYWSPNTKQIFVNNYQSILGGDIKNIKNIKYNIRNENNGYYVDVCYEIGPRKKLKCFGLLKQKDDFFFTWPLFLKCDKLKENMDKHTIRFMDIYRHKPLSRKEELIYYFLAKQVESLYDYFGEKDQIEILCINENDKDFINVLRSNFVNPEDGKIFISERRENINEIHHEIVHSILNSLHVWPTFIVREGYAEAFHNELYYKKILYLKDISRFDKVMIFKENEEDASSLDMFKNIVLAGSIVKYIIETYGFAKAVEVYTMSNQKCFGEVIDLCIESVRKFKEKYREWFVKFMKGRY